MSSATIRLHDVSKRLGTRWALARLELAIEPGRAVLLTGENGAGKTTLLKVLATLWKPTFGEVELFGVAARGELAALRRRLTLLTHSTHLYDAQSGRDNLRFWAGCLEGNAPGRVETSLERVSLSRDAHRPVRTYSAGMKRRLMLAGLLIKQPELVFLDEPWSALDPGGATLVDELIGEMRVQGTTLIIATHDIERARPLCDSHLALSQGRIVQPLTMLPENRVLTGGA